MEELGEVGWLRYSLVTIALLIVDILADWLSLNIQSRASFNLLIRARVLTFRHRLLSSWALIRMDVLLQEHCACWAHDGCPW